MAEDIQLESPDALTTLNLGRDATFTQALVVQDTISALPEESVLFIPLGRLVGTFEVTGYLDPTNYQQRRKDLWLAAKDWNTMPATDGQSRLIWGDDVAGGSTPEWDFNVAVISVTFAWLADQPGTSALKYVTFTLSCQEVGIIGSLN